MSLGRIRLKDINYPIIVFAIVLVVSIGVISTYMIVIGLIERTQQEFIAQARLISHAINKDKFNTFSATAEDAALPAYIELKQRLYEIRTSNDKMLFLYILGHDKATGNVFFFIDSQQSDSKDYAPPGLIYEEVEDNFRAAVISKKESFIGPVTDRWGSMVTAMVPLMQPGSDKVLGMLGMDIEVNNWYRGLVRACMLPVGLTFMVVILILLSVQLKLKTLELKKIADIDTLTGLFNRRRIFEQTKIELTRLSRYAECLSMVVVDIDNFKFINDKFGHLCGDLVLQEVARSLSQNIRKTDFVGRVGGEEFVVLLPNTSNADAARIAEKLRQAIDGLKVYQKEPDENEKPEAVSASFGVSSTQGPLSYSESVFEELYANADKALYESKSKGKNEVTVHVNDAGYSI